MFEPRVKNGQTDLLMKALLSLESTDEAYRFFEDLCTIAEIKSMAQRIEVAKMLREHATYQEIARQTGASSATISRVNRALLYGANGYTAVHLRQAGRIDAKGLAHRLAPAATAQVEELRAAGIGPVTAKLRAARERPDHPGIDGAQTQITSSNQ